MTPKPRLLFVSPQFLFPSDAGGKIRTAGILRGMKGGLFDITLIAPVRESAEARHAAELATVCDRFAGWPEPPRGAAFRLARLAALASPLPVPVVSDRTAAGRRAVAAALAERPDLMVIDYAHAAVLAPPRLPVPAVVFTHNVEAEIFRRHVEVARNPLLRTLWRSQYRKMERFERAALARFNTQGQRMKSR